jgi:hypothetical protein
MTAHPKGIPLVEGKGLTSMESRLNSSLYDTDFEI